jgi:hypothetical protein
MNKMECLEKAIEITKEYSRSGAGNGTYDLPAEVLEKVYTKLVKLAQEAGE